MSANSGYLVEYTNKQNSIQKGIVKHSEQREAFKKVNKVLVILCNEDFTITKNEAEKRIIALVLNDKLTIKGFID